MAQSDVDADLITRIFEDFLQTNGDGPVTVDRITQRWWFGECPWRLVPYTTSAGIYKAGIRPVFEHGKPYQQISLCTSAIFFATEWAAKPGVVGFYDMAQDDVERHFARLLDMFDRSVWTTVRVRVHPGMRRLHMYIERADATEHAPSLVLCFGPGE